MWVLLDTVLTEKRGKPIYFKGWSDYAPVTTADIRQAHTFENKEAAKLSAAYRHRESSFVPVEVEIVAVKSKAA